MRCMRVRLSVSHTGHVRVQITRGQRKGALMVAEDWLLINFFFNVNFWLNKKLLTSSNFCFLNHSSTFLLESYLLDLNSLFRISGLVLAHCYSFDPSLENTTFCIVLVTIFTSVVMWGSTRLRTWPSSIFISSILMHTFWLWVNFMFQVCKSKEMRNRPSAHKTEMQFNP